MILAPEISLSMLYSLLAIDFGILSLVGSTGIKMFNKCIKNGRGRSCTDHKSWSMWHLRIQTLSPHAGFQDSMGVLVFIRDLTGVLRMVNNFCGTKAQLYKASEVACFRDLISFSSNLLQFPDHQKPCKHTQSHGYPR